MVAKGMKASRLIKNLQKLIEKHGDLRVVAYCDHDSVETVYYEEESWIGVDGAPGNMAPAFEIG